MIFTRWNYRCPQIKFWGAGSRLGDSTQYQHLEIQSRVFEARAAEVKLRQFLGQQPQCDRWPTQELFRISSKAGNATRKGTKVNNIRWRLKSHGSLHPSNRTFQHRPRVWKTKLLREQVVKSYESDLDQENIQLSIWRKGLAIKTVRTTTEILENNAWGTYGARKITEKG